MNFQKRKTDPRRVAATLVALAGLSGCVPAAVEMQRFTAPQKAVANLPDTPGENLERLQRLAAERRAERRESEYVLGQGDLIGVHALALDELNQKVRVDGNGAVTLPRLGTVAVAGKTVSEVRDELTKRLDEFMYDAHVDVSVDEYHSQQVAVVGAVQRPGPVSLTGASLTVLDAISAAGGMTPEAAGRLYLIPAESRVQPPAGVMPAAFTDAPGAPARPAPIMIDMKELGQTAESVFFELPVRAGDVVMVPGGGQFIVAGWVEKPGNYPLKSTVTLGAAIATAGGFSFPANTARVRIHHLSASGASETHEIDYRAIAAGQASDVFVHDGDVIEAPGSAVKLIPYGFYKLVVDLVHFGAGVRVP